MKTGIQSHRRRGERGSAMMEMALGMTMMVMLLIGSMDFGPMLYCAIELEAAARAGAIYGSASTTNASDITGMQNTAIASARNLANVSATATRTCQCSGSTGTVSCSTTCSGNTAPMMYVSVTTQYTYTPMLQYPTVAYPLTMTRTATMRAQ